MTTPGAHSDDDPAASDPPVPAPRVDGRAPVLDGRPPRLPAAPPRSEPPTARPPVTPSPAPPATPPGGLARRSRTGTSAIKASAQAPPAPPRRRTAGPAPRPDGGPAPELPRQAAVAAGPAPAGGAGTATIEAPAPAVAPPVEPAAEAASAPAETMADRAIGQSLAQPPLPPHPGLGPTRKRLTVPPPSPPFVEADIPFHWQARLPSAVGRSVMVQIGDGKLDLGGTVVAIEDVRDARFKLQVEAALFRKAASARMTVSLELRDGSTVRVSARNAASSRRAGHIVETLTYLWTLLADTAGAEARALFVEKIDRGAEVQVGRLRLTGIGIAWKQNPIAPWSTIGDPRRVGLDVVIPRTEGEPIVVPLTADDAYQLPVLVPLLRQRFA